jgi:hypothetical protein
VSIKSVLICHVFFFLCLSSISAQDIIWANKNNIDKRTNFTKVIGQNKHGVYVLKHTNSSFKKYFIVEQFDKRMNLLRSKTFKINNAHLEKIVVQNEGLLVFTKVFENNNGKKLMMNTIDSNLNEKNGIEIVSSETMGINTNIKIYYNRSRSKFLVNVFSENGNNIKLSYYLMTAQSVLKKGETILNYKYNELYIGEGLMDEYDNLHQLLSQSDKFKSKNSADFFHYIFSLNTLTNISNERLINDRNTFISNYEIIENEITHDIVAVGFYGNRYEDENKGYFYVKIDGKTHQVKENQFIEIDRNIVSQIIGIKNEQKGESINKFSIKKLIPKMDGGLIIISERSFITTQSDIFYVNGVPQSSYARIFNNDEVLIFSLNPLGKTDWHHIINKNQSSINDGGYYNGIIVMINEAEFNILYNDRLSANADIIQVTFNEKGETSKKVLLNNEQYFALLIPSEYKQVNANSLVIPINQNRDYTYIKLIY